MADGGFPFPAVGLVHLDNRITQHRPIGVGEPLDLRVHADAAASRTRRGRRSRSSPRPASAASSCGRSRGTMLRRGGGDAARQSGRRGAPGRRRAAAPSRRVAPGRRPRPPLRRRLRRPQPDPPHALTAKPFGFPRAIAHGMWTKARCLAALEGRLPDAFTVDVEFRKPILLPAHGRLRAGRSRRRDRLLGARRRRTATRRTWRARSVA